MISASGLASNTTLKTRERMRTEAALAEAREMALSAQFMIERIDVAPDGISVTLHAAGIRSLVAELSDQEAPALAASEPLLEAAE